MATVKELESREKVCENKNFRNLIMLSKDNETLELNQYQKCHKALFVICTDLECVIEKIDRCKNNPENSSTTRVSKHIPSGFSMSTILLFRSIENKHDVYRGNDFLKKFFEFLRAHVIKIICFKKKK